MTIWKSLLLAGTMLATCSGAWAGQAPGALSAPDAPISHHDAGIRLAGSGESDDAVV